MGKTALFYERRPSLLILGELLLFMVSKMGGEGHFLFVAQNLGLFC